MSPADSGTPDEVSIDPQNPWLGLFSYSGGNARLFPRPRRGSRRTRAPCSAQAAYGSVPARKSGLGKNVAAAPDSVMPRPARRRSFCPVYVAHRLRARIALAFPSRSSRRSSRPLPRPDTGPGPAPRSKGESLWEFLHHREDLLRRYRRQCSHAIADLRSYRFEEIFTLGQADDAGRHAPAKEFLQTLTVPTSSRIVRRLRSKNASTMTTRQLRNLISPRARRLSHPDRAARGLSGAPGRRERHHAVDHAQNRMRLARMTGTQALSAVRKPGGRLVSEEVAESIACVSSPAVRNYRQRRGRTVAAEDPDLPRVEYGAPGAGAQRNFRRPAGRFARDDLSTEFYERTLADQPQGVRKVIEDELLTEVGLSATKPGRRTREESARRRGRRAGLIGQARRPARLLRIEERLDMRRVELTHDVLCSVVLAQPRPARRRTSAARRGRKPNAASPSRRRARKPNTARCSGHAHGRCRLRRADGRRRSERCVRLDQPRPRARRRRRKRRSHASSPSMRAAMPRSLSRFLIDDFTPGTRTDRPARHARAARAYDCRYYDGLPKELVTPQTETFRAMAIVREAAALNARGEVDTAYKLFGEAQAQFEKLRASGNNSEAVTYGLALSLYNQGQSALFNGRCEYAPRN